VGQESGVRDGEFLLALDVIAAQRGDAAEARIRIASIVDREWLVASDVRVEHVFDETSGAVRAMEREYYGSLVIAERHRPADPLIAAPLLAEGFLKRGLTERDEQLLRRLRFAGIERDARSLAKGAAHGRRTLREMVLADALSWDERQRLESEAPERVALPRGRSARLEYREDGGVMAEVKLQHLFGVLDTPVVGSRREPVLLAILAPNGRPVQLTRDLRSFWDRTYADVRKELRGRYPKHDWPDTP
jgi:ATP-dependent helicase HrpB